MNGKDDNIPEDDKLPDNDELVAAEYVLGTLDDAERRTVEGRFRMEPDMRQAKRRWERRLAGLDDGGREVTPTEGLWDRISTSIDDPPTPEMRPAPEAGFLTIRASQGEWYELMPGVEKKVLFQEAAEGVETFLVRIAPGVRLPEHGHETIEECLVVEGDVVLAGEHLQAGDFQAAFPGVSHSDIYSENGCLLYVRGEAR